MSKTKTRVQRLKDIVNEIDTAKCELEELKTEVELHVDNMSRTNLKNTEKYSILEQAAEDLRSSIDRLEDDVYELEAVEFG